MRRQLRRHTRNATEIDKKVHREFVGWFYNYVSKTTLNAKYMLLVY